MMGIRRLRRQIDIPILKYHETYFVYSKMKMSVDVTLQIP